MIAQAKRGPLPARGDVLDVRRALSLLLPSVRSTSTKPWRSKNRCAVVGRVLQLVGAENQHRHDEDDAHDDGGVRVALPGFVRALHHEQAQGD